MAYVTPATINTMVGAAAMPATGTSCWAYLYRSATIASASANVFPTLVNRYITTTIEASADTTGDVFARFVFLSGIGEAASIMPAGKIRKQTPAFMFPRPRPAAIADDDTLHNNTLIAVGFDADGLGIIFFKET